jgi:hypothetical protein
VADLYYVIRGSEDGDAYISAHTAADLQARLAEGYWGEGEDAPQWADTLPDSIIGEWSPRGVIIKGSIVQPRPVDVVKSWELP